MISPSEQITLSKEEFRSLDLFHQAAAVVLERHGKILIEKEQSPTQGGAS